MTPRRFVFAATLATLALLSKEVAFLLPPLAATVAFLYAPEGVPLGRRFTRSLVAAAPMAVGLALVAPARIFVLGGLIGTRPFASGLDPLGLLSMLGRVGAGVLGGAEIIAGATVPWVLCLALASVSVTAFALAPTEHRKAAASISWRPALFGALWFLALGATFAFGLILQPWYLLGSVAAYALLAAALVSGMWRIIKGGGVPAAASWVALLGTAGLLLSLGLHSPLLHSYDSWQEATDLQNDYLGSIQRDVDAAKNGDVVTAPKPPYLLKPNPQSGGLHGVAMLSGYSVVAWSKLTFPERNVTIAYGRRGDGQPRPDRVVVVLGKLIEEDGA